MSHLPAHSLDSAQNALFYDPSIATFGEVCKGGKAGPQGAGERREKKLGQFSRNPLQ